MVGCAALWRMPVDSETDANASFVDGRDLELVAQIPAEDEHPLRYHGRLFDCLSHARFTPSVRLMWSPGDDGKYLVSVNRLGVRKFALDNGAAQVCERTWCYSGLITDAGGLSVQNPRG